MKLLKEIMNDKYSKNPWIGMLYNKHIETNIDVMTLVKKALDLRIQLENLVNCPEEVTVEKHTATLDDAPIQVEKTQEPPQDKEELFKPAKKEEVTTQEATGYNISEEDVNKLLDEDF